MFISFGDEVVMSDPIILDGWVKWKQPALRFTTAEACEVTLGFTVCTAPKGWGTIDDVSLVPIE